MLLLLDSSAPDALSSASSTAAAAFAFHASSPPPSLTTSCRRLGIPSSPWLLSMCLASDTAVPEFARALAEKCLRCSGHFALQLDASSAACGAIEHTLPISPDPETEAIVRSELGPHELLAFIEGPERAWLRPEHLGNCSYRLPFRAQLPGKYLLHILQVRQEFAAMDETIDAFPPIDAVYITGFEGLQLTLGESAHGADHDKRTSAAAQSAVLSRTGLPRCTTGNAAGRFVYSGPLQLLYEAGPRAAHVEPSARLIDRTNYTTHPNQFEWRPYSCALTRFEPATLLAMTAGLRIDLFGDSHMRMLFEYMLQIPCNKSSSNRNSRCFVCAQSSICYISKHEGSNFFEYDNDSGHGPQRDVLIVNIGNHPASKWHRRLRDYSAEVRSVLDLFGVAADSSPHDGGLKAAIWLASTPITTSDLAFLYFYKDWRTTHRLRLFNEAALNETLRFLGPVTGAEGLYTFLDHFPLAMAAIQDSPDFAHLKGLRSALDGVVDQLFTEMLAQIEKRKEAE